MAISENYKKGAFILSRSIFDSDIWFKPAYYIKIWIWLIGKANHSRKRLTGQRLFRGQCLVTIREIIEITKWYVGYRAEKLSKSQVERVLDYLRKNDMIETTKTTRGMIVTICNYDTYQWLKNNERNNERNDSETEPKRGEATIDNNYNKEKNYKKRERGDTLSFSKSKQTKGKAKSPLTKKYEKALLRINSPEYPKDGEVVNKKDNGDRWDGEPKKDDASEILEYMKKKHKGTYGVRGVDFDRDEKTSIKLIGKNLNGVFEDNKKYYISYIDWMYDKKAKEKSEVITKSYLLSPSFMDEFTGKDEHRPKKPIRWITHNSKYDSKVDDDAEWD